MEFWGVEVKAGKPCKVTLKEGKLVRISQAALGEAKENEKGNESVFLRVNIDGQKIVLGSLIIGTIPQVNFNLILGKEFELSHDWTNGDVYFCGYMGDKQVFRDSPFDVKPTYKNKATKSKPSAKPRVSFIGPKMKSGEGSDGDDEIDEGTIEDLDGNGDGDDSQDDSEDEEETPTKPVTDKMKANESPTKTPVQARKAKEHSPQKTDGKKGGRVATPYPSAQNVRIKAGNFVAMAQIPIAEGKVYCQFCSRIFNSENSLESHIKDRHKST